MSRYIVNFDQMDRLVEQVGLQTLKAIMKCNLQVVLSFFATNTCEIGRRNYIFKMSQQSDALPNLPANNFQ